MNRYEDIIRLPHPVSATRARMSNADRAAQFAPFAALVGYDNAIYEAGRLTEAPIFLTESSAEAIDACLREIAAGIGQRMAVQVTFFRPDNRKAGGVYITQIGNVYKIDLYRKILLLETAAEIPFGNIVDICLLDKTEKM